MHVYDASARPPHPQQLNAIVLSPVFMTVFDRIMSVTLGLCQTICLPRHAVTQYNAQVDVTVLSLVHTSDCSCRKATNIVAQNANLSPFLAFPSTVTIVFGNGDGNNLSPGMAMLSATV